MAEVNQCNILCPQKAFAAAKYRQDSVGAGWLKRAALVATAGAFDTEQIARAAACPQRNIDAEDWRPRKECADAVRDALAARSIDAASLTEHEREVLAPYIEP